MTETRSSLVTAFAFLAFTGACIPSGMVRSATRDGMRPILEQGIEGFVLEPDLVLAEGALGANLKLIEAVALTYPEDRAFRLMAAMARATFAFGFVKDELNSVKITYPGDRARIDALAARAKQSYRLGRLHAESVLYENKDFSEAMGGRALDVVDLETFDRALATLTQEDAAALFWVAFNWGGSLEIELDVVEATHLPRLERMAARVLELDEAYFYGVGPHLLAGTLKGFRSPALGGSPDAATVHFERAKILGGGALLPDVMTAALVYAQTENQEGFERILLEVISATIAADHALLDAMAKRQACRLYANLDLYFLDDAKPTPEACNAVPQKHPLREVETP